MVYRSTVLVVDDEPEVLTALSDLLEEDFRVLTETSAPGALATLPHERDVAVIISDQRMPTMTGDAFLARSREISDAQTILMTGYADLTAVVSAVNRGHIIGYITKPWDPDALRAMVKSASDRYALARALATERALLRGLMDHTPDAVSFKDAKGRFIRINEVKLRALDVDETAICLGRPEGDFVPPARAREIEAAEHAVLLSRGPIEAPEERDDSGPEPRWTSVTRIPIIDRGSGETDYVVTVERDITERKLMEERMRQAEKLQALGQLTGGVAHDFNNLLMAISGSLQLLERQALSEEGTKLLHGATRAVDRGAKLTEQLLAFSRKQHLVPEAVDLNELIGGVSEMMQRSIGPTVEIETRLARDLWPALVDTVQIELALLNLAINGRDAMEDNGRLAIATRNFRVPAADAPADLKAGDFVAVAVTDTGSGIKPELLEKVFEPFFTTKELGRGSGLGLSMVYGLVKQSGGTVRIRSELGRGTSVELFLPRAPGKPTEHESDAGAAAPDRGTSETRILVIDDDNDVRELTASYLQGCGYSVIEAENGKIGLELLEQAWPLDLVLVDFAMPILNGAEIARLARERHPGLKVMLLTGYADTPLEGQIPVLRKPFRLTELAAKVAAVLVAADPGQT